MTMSPLVNHIVFARQEGPDHTGDPVDHGVVDPILPVQIILWIATVISFAIRMYAKIILMRAVPIEDCERLRAKDSPSHY